MSFPARLLQNVQNAAADAKIRVCQNAGTICNLIRNPKTYPLNIICQAIWILPDNRIDLRSICLVNFDCQRQCNSKLLQKDHCLTLFFLFFYLSRNFLRLTLTNSANFRQPFRLFFDQTKRIFAKFPNNTRCKCRADSFYCTGAKIPFHSKFILRLLLFIGLHFKLSAICRMFRINTCKFYIDPDRNTTQISNTGQFSFFCYKCQHTIAVFLVLKYEIINISCNLFQIRISCSATVHHLSGMKNAGCTPCLFSAILHLFYCITAVIPL